MSFLLCHFVHVILHIVILLNAILDSIILLNVILHVILSNAILHVILSNVILSNVILSNVILSNVNLHVILLNIVLLTVILHVILLNIVLLTVVLHNIILLNAVQPNIAAPLKKLYLQGKKAAMIVTMVVRLVIFRDSSFILTFFPIFFSPKKRKKMSTRLETLKERERKKIEHCLAVWGQCYKTFFCP
jgi:hypothetical protein